MEMEIKSEAMWALCSLACEGKLAAYICNETQVLQNFKDLLDYYFIDNHHIKGQVERENLLS
jgi:hypothetical protein